MTPTTYRTKDFDVLDKICVDHYGAGYEHAVSAVLAANPGLCRLPAVLSRGLVIVLPDIKPTRDAIDVIRIWG